MCLALLVQHGCVQVCGRAIDGHPVSKTCHIVCKAFGHLTSCLDLDGTPADLESAHIQVDSGVFLCAGTLQAEGLGQLQQWAMDVFRVCLVSNKFSHHVCL